MNPRRLLALLSTVAGLLVSAVFVAPPATAAVLGGVSWSATRGNAETLMSVTTERGCQRPAQRVSASVYGKGLPARGQVVVAPTTLLFSTTGPMTLPLSNAFVIYAERNSTGLDGVYKLKVKCTDRFGVNTLGEFGATMRWTTPGGSVKNIGQARFVATNTADVKPVPLPQPGEALAGALPTSSAEQAKPSAGADITSSAKPSATPTAGRGSPRAVDPSADPSSTAVAVGADNQARDSPPTSSLLVLALAAAVVALGGSAVWALGRRRSDR